MIEQGEPKVLVEKPDSVYHKYVDRAQAVADGLWSSDFWRRISIEKGRLVEKGLSLNKDQSETGRGE